jgi:peptide/nickel transport system permease protein
MTYSDQAQKKSANPEPELAQAPAQPPNTVLRIFSFVSKKIITLTVMVIIAVFLSIVLVNYGGGIDDIYRDAILMSVTSVNMNRHAAGQPVLTPEEERTYKWEQEEALGLHKPFLLRAGIYLTKALKLEWGSSSGFYTSYGKRYGRVADIIREHIPFTLILAGTANLFLFFTSISFALFLTRRGKERAAKFLGYLTPLSSIPNWIYGLVLILIFAATLHVLPYGGIFDNQPSSDPVVYTLDFIKHMILPFFAIFLGAFFISAHSWRSFFQLGAQEEYVDLAKAKGVPSNMLDRQYIVRPALPFILTSFILMLVTFWQGVVVLEMLFHWPGIGELFITAIKTNDRQISTALLVLFAYILAITILLTDIVIVLIDPRVSVENQETSTRSIERESRFPLRGSWHGWKRTEKSAERSSSISSGRKRNYKIKFSIPYKVWWRNSQPVIKQIARNPAAIVGLVIITILIIVSIATVIFIPPREAAILWRNNSPSAYTRPINAEPTWTNLFRKNALPLSIILDSAKGEGLKTVKNNEKGFGDTVIEFGFDYPYETYPQDLTVLFETEARDKLPFVILTWITPDGREFELVRESVSSEEKFTISRDYSGGASAARAQQITPLLIETGGQTPVINKLFTSSNGDGSQAQKGLYTLRVEGFTFENGSTLDAQMILYGKVFGVAGTDNLRRDLKVGLLWGLPVALSVGIIGALATTILSVIIAAIAAWFGGWVNGLIQRVSEISMIIPTFALALTIFYMVSNSIWVTFAAIILLMIFGNAVKTYYAAFQLALQSSYIESARAYGASDWRIIWRYMVPPILPLVIPQFTIMVPFFVFYETSLAFVGVMDPVLPTWGKIVHDALSAGAYSGYNYWVIQPIVLILITGLAFTMLGTGLNTALNPKEEIY